MAFSEQSASTLRFDITEVVRYAKRHDRVTGIQRVELNVIRECVRQLSPRLVRGLIREDGGQRVREVSLAFLSEDESFVASKLLHETDAVSAGWWPDKLILRKHLDHLQRRKVLRAVKKASIYVQALVARKTLIENGLLSGLRAHSYAEPTAVLAPNDAYIALGTGWEDPDAFCIAAAHRRQGGKVIQMVHDLIPVVRPELHMPEVSDKFQRWLERATTCVTQFLCVSEHTAKDLRDFLSRQEKEIPIAVTPLAHEFTGFSRGAEVELPPDACEAVSKLISQRFVLCVGSLEGRKNITRLLTAWASARALTGDTQTKLVFAGRRGWMIDSFDAEMRQTQAAGGSAQVIEKTTDAELAWLYAHSEFTVYPSLYEGWGLPVGESLWFDTPCLASSATSVPEVGNSLVTYVFPYNTEMMATLLGQLLTDKEALLSARTRIKNAVLRTWRDHAADVIQAIHEHMAPACGEHNGVSP